MLLSNKKMVQIIIFSLRKAYPYQYFNEIEHYDQTTNESQKEGGYSSLEGKLPNDADVDRINTIKEASNFKMQTSNWD